MVQHCRVLGLQSLLVAEVVTAEVREVDRVYIYNFTIPVQNSQGGDDKNRDHNYRDKKWTGVRLRRR